MIGRQHLERSDQRRRLRRLPSRGPLLPLAMAAMVVCGRTLPAGAAGAGCYENSTRIRPQDQIWLISARRASCDAVGEMNGGPLTFYRFEPGGGPAAGRWRTAGMDEFLADGPADATTIFFVHGNRVSSQMAFSSGLAVYRILARQARNDRPFRFVTWSWPSDRLCGPLKDARIKAWRTIPAAIRLAWLVNRMDPDLRIGMMGFSYGARVITGALHLLGGGSLGSYRVQSLAGRERAPVRAVLMTAALDNDWLLPGHFHGRALSRVDRMLLLNNACDRAMRWYPWIDRCRRPTALGRFGMASAGRLGSGRHKIEQHDVSHLLGKVHDFNNYLRSGNLMARAWPYVAHEPIPPTRVRDGGNGPP